jgi:hypothetical protein
MGRSITIALVCIIIAASFLVVYNPVLADSVFWTDNFNDGNYNGWTVYSGSWSVVGGKLRGQGGFDPIYTDMTFPSDRTVQSEIRTETAGGAEYAVAALMIKWVT